METTKKSLLILMAVVVVGGSAYGAFYLLKKYIKKEAAVTQQTDQTASSTSVELADEYPPGITEKWILESGVTVTSKSQNISGEALQGTLVYESKLSQKNAAEGYQKFLQSQGWTATLTENKKAGLFNIHATKGGDQAFILIDQNDVSKKVTVDVTVITQ